MESKVALIGIIVENKEETSKLNEILHAYGNYIIGRMGIPHSKNDIAIISVVMEAPADVINTVSGKIGMIKGINSKVIYAPDTVKTKKS